MSGLPSDRRSHPRQSIANTGSNPVIATVGILPRAALVYDLTPNGLGLLTTFAPPVGALLPVWLPGPPGQPSNLVLVTVIHVQPPGSDGLFQMGVVCHDDNGRTVLGEMIARLGGGGP